MMNDTESKPVQSVKDFKKLFISNIPNTMSQSELQKELDVVGVPYGRIYLPQIPNGGNKGFGFIDFNNEDDCRIGYDILKSFKLGSKRLIVDFADQKA